MRNKFTAILIFTIFIFNSNIGFSKNDLALQSIKRFKEQSLNIKKSISSKKSNALKASTLIPLYDSIYDWNWDTNNNGWEVNAAGKYINFTYDANYNTTGIVYQIWNGSNWVNDTKGTFVYNGINYYISELFQSWNGTAWVNANYYTHTYNASNFETSNIGQVWNGSAWENDSRFISTYDLNNNLTGFLAQSWNVSFWDNINQTIYTYDLNNNLTSVLNQAWNVSTFENISRNTYSYNANNTMSSLLYEYWNSNAWNNGSQTTFTYNINNNNTGSLQQIWNGTSWENSIQQSFGYDTNNNLTYELLQTWNGNAWVNQNQTYVTFDINNNQLIRLAQGWDGNNWLNQYKNSSTFDANSLLKSDAYRQYDSLGATVQNGDSSYNYFSQFIIGESYLNAGALDFTISPNPATDFIKLNSDYSQNEKLTVAIYNLNGVLVKQETDLKKNKNINLSDLSSGIYIVSVKSNFKIEKQKLIIQR